MALIRKHEKHATRDYCRWCNARSDLAGGFGDEATCVARQGGEVVRARTMASAIDDVTAGLARLRDQREEARLVANCRVMQRDREVAAVLDCGTCEDRCLVCAFQRGHAVDTCLCCWDAATKTKRPCPEKNPGYGF